MTGASGYGTGSISFYAGLLWVWTILVTLIAGVAAAFAFSTYDEFYGRVSPNGVAGLLGLIAGALSTLPFWALFGVGAHVVHRLDAQRAAAQRLGHAAVSSKATTQAPAVDASREVPTVPANADVATLLADPKLREQAGKIRRSYGRNVAASFLTRKANEAGFADLVVTEDDLPADL